MKEKHFLINGKKLTATGNLVAETAENKRHEAKSLAPAGTTRMMAR